MERDEGNDPPSPDAVASGLALTVVVPAFNESLRLEDGMDRLFETFAHGVLLEETTEIVVVDDGSSDDTAARAGRLLTPLPHHRVLHLGSNAGKGAAVRNGVAAAHGPLVAFTDADMSIEPNHLAELVPALEHADVAIGCRSLPGRAVDYDNLPRTLMGRAFNRVVNAATNISLDDTQCGFKGFRTPVARLLFHFNVSDGFAFDVGLLHCARRFGLRIAEVPVRWRHVADSRVRPVRDPVSMLGDIMRSRSRLDAVAPVPGLTVRGAERAAALAALHSSVGRHLPVIEEPDGGVLVLFALCGDDDTRVVRQSLALAAPGARYVEVTFADLVARAPLSVLPSRREEQVPI